MAKTQETIKVEYTRQEILERIRELEQDPDLQLYFRQTRLAERYRELGTFLEQMEKKPGAKEIKQ